jgi:hypothetical protein
MVGNDLDQAPFLASTGKRVAIESEAGKVSEALAHAVRDAAGDKLVDDPARADAIVYAGTDVRSAVGVAESLARENPRAKIVFPVELTRAGIADRLPRRVLRRAVFATSAPERDAEFEAAFKQHFGRTPDPYALLGYQAMQRVLKAIEDAGGRAHLRSVVADRYFQLSPVSKDFRLISSRALRRQ